MLESELEEQKLTTLANFEVTKGKSFKFGERFELKSFEFAANLELVTGAGRGGGGGGDRF